MVVRSERFVAIFAAMKVPDFLRKVTAEPFNEVAEVMIVEGIIAWDVMSQAILFVGAFVEGTVGESDEAIAVSRFVQMAFVDDSHSPHESPIKTAAKTLAASNFHLADSVRGSFEDERATRVLEAL